MTIPSVVDQLTRDNNITLTEIRRAIPPAYLKPRAVRSWWTLLRVVVSIAACVFALSLIELRAGREVLRQIPALVLLWILYGWVLVGLFVIGHDCGHGSFSSNKWVNDLVGHLCMSPLGNGFHAWKLTHNQHHAHTQLRGHEVDWASRLVTREEFESDRGRSWLTRLGYAAPFGVALWIGWNTIRRGFMIRTLIPRWQFTRERGRLIGSGAIMVISLVALYGGLWYGFGFWGMMKFFGIPAILANITGSVIITIQHANEHSLLYEKEQWTPLRGQVVSTFNVRFPAWLEYLWSDINVHIPHHVAPNIPWYYLKQTSQILQQAYPDYYQEQTFGLRHFTWWRRTPFLRKIEDKGYYVFEKRG